jgi:hypothetical protein
VKGEAAQAYSAGGSESDTAFLGGPHPYTKISRYGYEGGYSGFSGFFAEGGYIPPGSWGIAGESGPEVINRSAPSPARQR